MSNYVKATNFATKDALLSGNPAKIIKGTEIDTEFNNIATAISTKADLASPTFTGTPAAPTASPGTNTTQVATTAFVTAAAAAINSVPSGMIAMWSGSVATIPTGWVLCNGSNGTPDLRDRFIIGARQDDSGTAKTNVTGSLTQTGGSKDAIVVSHTHTATVTDPGHTHTYFQNTSSEYIGTGNLQSDVFNDVSTNTGSATTGITVANSTEGSSGTNANLPPYYALAFIMKT